MILSFLLLISNASIECAQLTLHPQKQKQENCLCKDCNRWLIPAQPHPFSQGEKSAAQALYASRLPNSLIDLIFEYTGQEYTVIQWLTRTQPINVLSVQLNNRLDGQPGNYYHIDAHFLPTDVPIFPKNVIFGDGKSRLYRAQGIKINYNNLVQLVEANTREASSTMYSEKFEQVSLCGKHKAIISNNRGYAGRFDEPAITLQTFYTLGSIADRVKAYLHILNVKHTKQPLQNNIQATVKQRLCS